MTITVYFVRHLPTQYNIDKIITGREDPPVLPDSFENAKSMLPVIASWGITRIGTGKKNRQTQTAKFIGDFLGLQVDEDERLNERYLGRFENVHYADVNTEGLSLQIYLALKEDLDDNSNPHIPKQEDNPGETQITVRKRVREYLNDKIWYPNVPDGETTILVVSEILHYYILGEMYIKKTGRKTIDEMFLPLTGISRLSNFHYSQYIIYNPTNENKRVTEQVKGDAKIPQVPIKTP